jgi:hypothetical protein
MSYPLLIHHICTASCSTPRLWYCRGCCHNLGACHVHKHQEVCKGPIVSVEEKARQ